MLPLIAANLKIMSRNRQVTFWALFFPLMLVVVFGLFDLDTVGSSSMTVIDQARTPESFQLTAILEDIEVLLLEEPPASPDAARRLVADGSLNYLLIIPAGFSADPLSVGGEGDVAAAAGDRAEPASEPQSKPQSEPASITLVQNTGSEERNQLVAGIIQRLYVEVLSGDNAEEVPSPVITETLQTRQVSYFDLVLLGLVGMGIMTNSIISGAVRISTYRSMSILKRVLVTPLSIWKFFAAEITSQLLLAIVQAVIILLVGVYIFKAQISGNVLYLLPFVLLGSITFLNIGFIISAWAKTPAAAAGMGNAAAFPMMFFAGTFFPTSSLPWLLPYVADALPLAPMLTGFREIAINEASLWQVWPQLAVLSGWVAGTSLAAIRIFRFS
jgi:ABC-2 type transport system permease protein